MDPAVVVLAAGFEEKDAGCWIFAEPCRDGATGGAGANHDEIGLDRVELNGHPAPPLLSRELCHAWLGDALRGWA